MAALCLAAAYLAAALHGLGAADIVGDDEAREAGLVQEIVAGHWLWPVFNDELLPDKPLLFHWLAALPCATAGFSEAAVRLPSALAGAALVAVTAAVGADLFGGVVVRPTSGLLATTPALFTHARVARPDALLVALLTAALGLAFRAWRDRRARDATWSLGLLGAAVLAKGPVAPALFALTVWTFLVWQRDLRALPRLLTSGGLFALVVLGLGWYVVALAGWGERFVAEHLVGRYLHNLAGGLVDGRTYSPRPWWYHLLFYPQHLPAVALPWTPLIAVALWHVCRGGQFADPRVRFLVCWAAAPVLVFTPAEWKLRYYLLPALPPLALIAAPQVVRFVATPRSPGLSLGRATAAGLVLLLAAAVLAALTRPEVLSRSDRAVIDALLAATPGGLSGLAAGVGVAAGLGIGTILIGSWPALVGAVTAGALGWIALGAPLLEQTTARRASLRAFAEAVAARYPEPAPLAALGPMVRPVVVYANRHVRPAARLRDLPAGTAVIAPEPVWERHHAAGRLGPAILSGEGRLGNLARGRIVLAEVP